MHPQSIQPRWTPQEDQFLRDNVPAMTHAAIGMQLGRSKKSVRNRAWRLRLIDTSDYWSKADVALLRAYYGEHCGRALDLGAFARQLGRTVTAVIIKAGRLGLRDRARPRTVPVLWQGDGRVRHAWSQREDDILRANPSLTAAELSTLLPRSVSAIRGRRRTLGLAMSPEDRRAIAGRRWKLYPHPRGALGYKHTPDAKAKMSAAHKADWVRARATGTSFMSEENRQLRSDAMAQRQATDPRLRQGFSRAAGGTRADLGFYVRSRWEANIARYLKWLQERGEIYSWAYESTTFWFEGIKRGTRSYLPDFEIVEREGGPRCFWEVKGWDHPRGKTALARMARYHPDVRITVIDQDAYKAIAQWRALIPHWEAGHGSHKL